MTQDERERLVAVFEWLLKEDKKQNPQNYIVAKQLETEPQVFQPLN